MLFANFKAAIQSQINRMFVYDKLFVVGVPGWDDEGRASFKDEMWQEYLTSFPDGTNNIFRTNTYHDCSECRQFVRNFGNVVAIDPKTSELITIWDLHKVHDNCYSVVAQKMGEWIRAHQIADVYMSSENFVGVDENHEIEKDENGNPTGEILTWSHLYTRVPTKFVIAKYSLPTFVSDRRTNRSTLARLLNEWSEDDVDTILELIESNSLYRGNENKERIEAAKKLIHDFGEVPEAVRENWIWNAAALDKTDVCHLRNTAIGTLITDVATGRDLNEAVTAYERMVAPENYRRPKEIFTKKMLADAEKTVVELGLMDSLPRRFANADDITVNNILYANYDAAARVSGSNIFADMAKDTKRKPMKFDGVREIGIEDFVSKVLPGSSNVEVYLDGGMANNMVSLIAPKNAGAPSMFKWNNGFSWAYNGNLADSSIRENVKAAGGKVDGVLRCSLQWNDGDTYNQCDYDLHARIYRKERDGWESSHHIYFGNKGFFVNYKKLAELDVDITSPRFGKAAVENIVFSSIDELRGTSIDFYVHDFACRSGDCGFKAEVVFGGHQYSYEYPHALGEGKDVHIATITVGEDLNMTINHKLEPVASFSDNIWGLKTNDFVPVSMVMMSPNYWDDQRGIGNRHYFFMLKDCVNPDSPNGFYNEYLRGDLLTHKRVFAALGTRMAVEHTDDQLSGVGFSDTKRGAVVVRVTNKTTRVFKVKF